MKPQTFLCFLSLVVVASLTFAGCDLSDPGMEEKLARSQAELEALRRDLKTAQEQIESLRGELKKAHDTASPAAAAGTGASATQSVETSAFQPVPAEELEEGYVLAARQLRRKLDSDLQEAKVVGFTMYNVEVAPAVTNPYTSRVKMEFTKQDGSHVIVDLPVGADFRGSWTFPTIDEIRGEIARGGTPSPVPTVVASTPATPSESQPSASTPQPVSEPTVEPMAPGAETIVVDWGDGAGMQPAQPTAPRQQTSGPPQEVPSSLTSPPAAAQPPEVSQPSIPAPVRPVDRDVIIKFD